MKTKLTRTIVTLGAALGLGWGSLAIADSPAASADLKTSGGVLTGINQKENTVQVKTFWGTRKYNVADDCKVSLQDKPEASMTDLRPGQKVEIGYDNVHGVTVAHKIAQQNVAFTGYVKSIDPAKRTMTVRSHMLDKTFWIADDCKIVLRDDKSGTLNDVQPGHHITVTYETPDDALTAHRIDQTSVTFSGALTAIDLGERTLKAKSFLNDKKFNLADNCRILVGDNSDAKLSDLKLGDKLVISYDDVNGINIVSRIATTDASAEMTTSAADKSHAAGLPAPPVY